MSFISLQICFVWQDEACHTHLVNLIFLINFVYFFIYLYLNLPDEFGKLCHNGNFYEYKLFLMDDTQCARPKNYIFKMYMLSQPESDYFLNKGRLYHRLSLFACQTRRLLNSVSFINYCPNHYV